MRKIKFISLLLSLLISGNVLFAQSVDEGKRFLYYERYNSARDVFSRLVNANPNNIDAVYWLGQAYLGNDDIASAKALYQKTLNANPNSPLMLVAMGEIALLENNTAEARNRFETAISLTRGRDYNVLNAIGRANVDAKAGDAAYAIGKLNQIPENKRTGEMWITLGDAYRKMADGASAVLAYQKAISTEPNNAQTVARANFMIGRIYQTQGYTQENIYMPYYTQAFTKDPNFAPVYEWLSEYYYYRDINKARDYLDKYIAVADPDTKNCYYQATFLYASGKNQEAINKADQCIAAGGQNTYPNLYGLKAYAYDKLGDSANARTYFQTYFQKQSPDKLGPKDYATYGKILLKFPGNEALAASYVDKAVALDTLEANKLEYITGIANSYLAAKNYNEAANWYKRLLSIKKNVTKTDLFDIGYNYYRGGNYRAADSIFVEYQQKYPDDVLGYYLGGISNAYIDSTGALGLAKADYEKVIQLASASTDTLRSKPQLITAYNYMIAYYYKKNDYPTALSYVDKILALDPTNTQAIENQKALQNAIKIKTKGDETKVKTETSKEKVTPNKTKVKHR